jgi:small subunit ribosomal protein S3Ae
MAKIIKKKQNKIKTKKKSWYAVHAPKLFGLKQIGESYLTSPDKAVGRLMKINLRNLTDSFRDQNINLTLKINNFKGQNLETEIIGYQIVPTFIKRLVRKRTSRLDDLFIVKTKDGKNVLLKTLIIAFNRNNRSTGTVLRNNLKELITKEAASMNYDVFANAIITSKIKMGLKKQLKKVYPVKEILVRYFKLVDLKDLKLATEEVLKEKAQINEEVSQAEESSVTESKEEEKEASEELSEEIQGDDTLENDEAKEDLEETQDSESDTEESDVSKEDN